MSAVLLDGKAIADKILVSLEPRVDAIKKKRGRAPGLLVIASDDKNRPSKAYRQAQLKACAAVGIRSQLAESQWTEARYVLNVIEQMSDFDGVIIDLPLPKAVDVDELLSRLAPSRDAEGATPHNYGRLFEIKSFDELRRKRLVAPCTALAVAELLRACGPPLAGKTAAMLGRSNIVGKPAAHLLSCLDMTVTLCHSKTRELPNIVAAADVVVAAMGRAHMVKADWIKPGAVVIDAGINAEGSQLVGDVEPAALERAGYITPVPGGVGPVTNALLLANTVTLAERSLSQG